MIAAPSSPNAPTPPPGITRTAYLPPLAPNKHRCTRRRYRVSDRVAVEALRVDEVHLRGVDHIRVRAWRVNLDLVGLPDGPQARVRAGQEVPRRDRGQPLLAGERRHIRYLQVIAVDVHGQEHHMRRARAQ